MPIDDRQVRRFADFLAELDDGASHEELSDALNELVSAVSMLGKTGTITYTIKVKPAGRNSGGTVMITDDIRVKLPTGERSETIWYVDSNGNCVRHNPNQLRMPLKEVPAQRPVVDDETGEVVG